MIRPLATNSNLLLHASPIDDIIKELSVQLTEFKALKAKRDAGMTSS